MHHRDASPADHSRSVCPQEADSRGLRHVGRLGMLRSGAVADTPSPPAKFGIAKKSPECPGRTRAPGAFDLWKQNSLAATSPATAASMEASDAAESLAVFEEPIGKKHQQAKCDQTFQRNLLVKRLSENSSSRPLVTREWRNRRALAARASDREAKRPRH